MKKSAALFVIAVSLAAFIYLNAAQLPAAWNEHRAQNAEDAGHPEQALELYQRAAQTVPRHAEYQREACRLARELYDPAGGNLRLLYQAKAACARALDDDKAYPYHWYEMSLVLYALLDAGADPQDQPQRFLDRALELDPGNPRFLGGNLLRQIEDGKIDLAWKTFILILNNNPASIKQYGPLLLREPQDYRKLVSLAAADKQTDLTLASYLWKKGQAELSKEVAAKVPADQLQDPFEAGLFGGLLVYQGKSPEAEKLLTPALQKHPKNYTINVNLGLALDSQKEWDRAIAHYTKAIQIFPDSAYFHIRLAMAEQEKGLTALAFDQYHAAALCPDLSTENKKKIYFKIAAIKEQNRDYEGAIGEYRLALDLAPEDEDLIERIQVLKVKIEYQKSGLDVP